jgi:hypothetical protein
MRAIRVTWALCRYMGEDAERILQDVRTYLVRLRRTIHILCLAVISTWLLHCAASHDLLSLTVAPATASMSAAGQTIQFKAEGTDVRVSESPRTPATTDWTHRVTWSSSTAAVATIDSSGLATGVGPGVTTITASASGTSATATLTVSTPGSESRNFKLNQDNSHQPDSDLNGRISSIHRYWDLQHCPDHAGYDWSS